MALLTTATTGLALLAGVVLLRVVYGTFDLAEMLAAGAPPAGSEGLLAAAFLCCFAGIAGKSALFPFHYWLPNAMAAPTPVSAYLHSATMVKLGVFLTARLLPVFGGLESWGPILTGLGFGTFVLGAVFALLSHDLKAVLANTTVAQLGLLVGYYGLHETGQPVSWDALHILNHVFYKACLFMVVGIIDHSTGTRDARQLGGLWRKMPILGTAALLALAAFAGLPPTTGFLSKEMLLIDVYNFNSAHPGWAGAWPLWAVVAGSTVNVAVAARVAAVFWGRTTPVVEEHFHAPSAGLQAPPILLGLATLALGLAAGIFGDIAAGFADSPGRAAAEKGLYLWHGVTRELITSLAVVGAGILVYRWVGRERWSRVSIPKMLRFDLAFDHVVESVPYAARRFNRALGFETPYAYLFVVGAVMCVVPGWIVVANAAHVLEQASAWRFWPATGTGWTRWVVVVIAAAAAVFAAGSRRVLAQLFALSIIGLSVMFYYVLYQGPDLAATQLLVESATLILVLMVVLRLKREGADVEPLSAPGKGAAAARLILSVAGGLLLGGGVLFFQQSAVTDRAGDYYLEHTTALAKGTNAVNTTVIDFRGFDTLLEICVLVIATLGCLGLLARRRADGADAQEAASRQRDDLFPVPRDFILRMVAVWGFVPLNLFAVHVFLRGHNEPGGGFPAGLVTALSLILLTFVLGVHGVRKLVRINPIIIASGGVTLAVATALVPVAVGGLPVFHHFHHYLGGFFYIGGAFWFDLGVYLAVVGTALKMILPLMKSVHGLPALVTEEESRFAARGDEPIDLAEVSAADTGKEGR